MEKLQLSWAEVDDAVKKLATDIWTSSFNKEKKPTCIVPIVRGGLPIGTILSHYLGIKDVWPISFQTRDGDRCEPERVWELLECFDRVIFAEDILDSGETLKLICEAIKGNKKKSTELILASLCQTTKFQDHSRDTFDYKFNIFHVGQTVDWVVFPWEVESIVENLGGRK